MVRFVVISQKCHERVKHSLQITRALAQMDLSDSDMDTSSLSSSVSSEEGELEAEVEKSIEENHGDLGIAEEDQLADLLAESIILT